MTNVQGRRNDKILNPNSRQKQKATEQEDERNSKTPKMKALARGGVIDPASRASVLPY